MSGVRFLGEAERHPPALRAVHWLTAGLVACLFATNWLREGSAHGSAIRKFWLQSHELAGCAVFGLTLLRLGLRLGLRSGLRKAGGTAHLARMLHGVFYGFLLVLPVFGLLWALFGASAKIAFWTLPAPAGRNPAVVDLASRIHSHVVAYVFLALIGIHGLAAAWHGLVRRDGVVRRML